MSSTPSPSPSSNSAATNAARCVRLGKTAANDADIVEAIRQALGGAEASIGVRTYIGRKAAKRGRIDVLELIAAEEARTRTEETRLLCLFDWTVAHRAARARQYDVLRWLLKESNVPRCCEFHPAIAEAVLVAGEFEVLGWIYDSDCADVDVPKLCTAAVAASPGPVTALEWIRAKWPAKFRELRADEFTCAILNDCNNRDLPLSEYIAALDWGRRNSLLRLDASTSHLAAATDQTKEFSVGLFKWLYLVSGNDPKKKSGYFNALAMAEGAVCFGNIGIMELIIRENDTEGIQCLMDPNTSALAARYGNIESLRWLVQLGNPISSDAAACAFAYGKPDVLDYLYFEVYAPFGCWRGRRFAREHAPASVAIECWEFYQKYADDWACGIYPLVNLKPAYDVTIPKKTIKKL